MQSRCLIISTAFLDAWKSLHPNVDILREHILLLSRNTAPTSQSLHLPMDCVSPVCLCWGWGTRGTGAGLERATRNRVQLTGMKLCCGLTAPEARSSVHPTASFSAGRRWDAAAGPAPSWDPGQALGGWCAGSGNCLLLMSINSHSQSLLAQTTCPLRPSRSLFDTVCTAGRRRACRPCRQAVSPVSHIPPVARGCSLACLGQVEGSGSWGMHRQGGQQNHPGLWAGLSFAHHLPLGCWRSWKGCPLCYRPHAAVGPSRQGWAVSPLRHPSSRLQPDVGLVSSTEPSAVSLVASFRQGLAEGSPGLPAWGQGHGEPVCAE